jgi:hypothetical protein
LTPRQVGLAQAPATLGRLQARAACRIASDDYPSLICAPQAAGGERNIDDILAEVGAARGLTPAAELGGLGPACPYLRQ